MTVTVSGLGAVSGRDILHPAAACGLLKDGEGARHAKETPPQAAAGALTGRRLRFPEPSRFGVGTAGMEQALTHGGSAEPAPPQRELRRRRWGPGWSSLLSQGWRSSSGLSVKPA